MANRKERRAANKAKPAYMRKTDEELRKALVKNGITTQDLETNYNMGYKAGYHAAGEQIVKGCYAAVCLAMHELHGFGHKRCADLLNKIDEVMLYQLTTEEAVEEVWKNVRLRIDFSEAFDRVEEA